jgi:hypothetical protein
MATAKARPKLFDGPYGDNHVLWQALEYFRIHPYRFIRPMELARMSGCTRTEAALALRLLVAWESAKRRDSDGRFYCVDKSNGVSA